MNRLSMMIVVVSLVLVAGALTAAFVVLAPATPGSADVDRADFVAPYGQDPLPAGTVHDIALVAAVGTTQLDGATATEVWSFNGSVPGPEIRIRLGDTVRIAVQNDLDVATSVHWHGLRVPNDMDGVPGVNQPPIPPGGSFVYEFTPPDPGTYWYHSHKRGNEQLERGLYGSFVVEDAQPEPYSQDLIMMVDDWLLDSARQLDPEFDSSDDVHHNGRWGSDLTVNGKLKPTLAAAPGERLRLRMVNASTARIYQLRFGELDAVAIAMDGLLVDTTFPADGVEIAPGNRIDVDVTIPADATGRFEITDSFTGIDPLPLLTVDVVGEPIDPPQFDPPTSPVPDWRAAVDWAPTGTIEITLIGEETSEPTGLAGGAEGVFRWALNGRSWPEPATHVSALGKIDKLRFVNDSGSFHPMHLHGQFFQVVARNGVPVREGHFRDTVLLNGGDIVDIVVVATDAGVWALHCHIQLHAEYGMSMLYDVR